MQYIRAQVRAVWPNHSADLRINPHTCEVIRVLERCEHAVETDHRREIDGARGSVVEREVQTMVLQWTGLDDVM